jgi:hypothetical protein
VQVGDPSTVRRIFNDVAALFHVADIGTSGMEKYLVLDIFFALGEPALWDP